MLAQDGSSSRRRGWNWQTFLLDAVLAAALDLVTILPLLHDGNRSVGVWLLDQALVLPLAFRRKAPRVVFLLIAVLAAVQWLSGERLVVDVALLVALYTVAAHEPRRDAVAAAALLEVGVVLASVRFVPTGDGILGSLVFLTGLVAASLLLGTSVQARQDRLANLVDRAHRLEVERDQQGQLGAAAERTRIAREMHDIVAHSLTVIVALAEGAAATMPTDPAAAAEAVAQVADTGRNALGEMRQLLGVLRADGDRPASAPQPLLADLDDLLDEVRSTGLAVRLSVRGVPLQPTPTHQLTIYRTIQEALTNTMKHGREAKQAQVNLSWRPSCLEILVTDDGQLSPVVEPPRSTIGQGLNGMRERVAVHGGTLTTGPRPEGGWTVKVLLPLALGDSR